MKLIVGLGLLVIGIIIGILGTPPVLQAILYRDQISACWSPGVISEATDLAKRTAANIFKDTIPFNATVAQKATLASSFGIKLYGFFVIKASPQVAEIKCGAAMDYSYQKLDGTPYSHEEGSIISFSVYPSAYGPSPTMSRADLEGGHVGYSSP